MHNTPREEQTLPINVILYNNTDFKPVKGKSTMHKTRSKMQSKGKLWSYLLFCLQSIANQMAVAHTSIYTVCATAIQLAIDQKQKEEIAPQFAFQSPLSCLIA